MKRILVVITLFSLSQLLFCQKSELESKLKNVSVKVIMGDKLLNYDILNQSKNKVVIIQFWEKSDKESIESMTYLKKLKEKYANDLKVICISGDQIYKTINLEGRDSYHFDFIVDNQNKISTIFPHSLIPSAVLIDKKGKIIEQINPKKINEILIDKLISGKEIEMTWLDKNNQDKSDNVIKQKPLISFELLKAEVDDKHYISTKIEKNKRRIISGSTPTAFVDTIESYKECVLAGKNILELYQYAYANKSALHYTYLNDIKYIDSHKIENLYELNYSVSSLLGDFNDILIRQLNAALGLETEKIEIETTALILKKIEENGNTVQLTKNVKSISKQNTSSFKAVYSRDSINIAGSSISVKMIANAIESSLKLPVIDETNMQQRYDLNIALMSKSHNIDDWLLLFQKEGIQFVKEKRKIELIRIKKTVGTNI